MKKIKLILATLFVVTNTYTQIQETSIEAAQSIYIYSFTRNVDWGNSLSTNEFVVTVLGSNSSFNELKRTMNGKKVINRLIKVVQIKDINELNKSEIIYLSNNKYKLIPQILSKLNNPDNVLFITENPDALNNGSCINFYMNDDKLKFEINKENIDKQKLKITISLISSARPRK